MKRNLFLLAILPFSLAVALCACGSTPGESTPSEKTQSSVSQAQTDSAATGNEISIGNNFSIEAGTVLSDGSIYFVGREGADGFCAYVSTDDGDSWIKEELPWADQTVVGIKLRPDGFMLGMDSRLFMPPAARTLKLRIFPRWEQLTEFLPFILLMVTPLP